MPTIKNYRDLLVWQKAMDLCTRVYRLADLLPKQEDYGLKAQTRRAAVSIPANIAEGHGRDHLGDYLHHLSIAKGSLAELETHLLLAVRLGYVTEPAVAVTLRSSDEISRMLNGLSASLKLSVSKKP